MIFIPAAPEHMIDMIDVIDHIMRTCKLAH